MRLILGQAIPNTQISTCRCCSLSYCQSKRIPCSTNVNCECLWMTMAEKPMCADTVVPCQDLFPCENDNKTCAVPNTVCVSNTKCNNPVCFPIDRASSQRCPPLDNKTSIITKGQLFFIILDLNDVME